MAENVVPRNSTSVYAKLRRFLAKLYAAIDQSQRKRADRIIQRYSHLLPDPDEHNNKLQKYVTRTSRGNGVDRTPTNPRLPLQRGHALEPPRGLSFKNEEDLW